jgi:hypothetical protein
MTTIFRYIAAPVVSVGIIGGAALGSAGLATAATTRPDVRPGIVATDHTTAAPASAFATDRPFCHPRKRCRGPYHR